MGDAFAAVSRRNQSAAATKAKFTHIRMKTKKKTTKVFAAHRYWLRPKFRIYWSYRPLFCLIVQEGFFWYGGRLILMGEAGSRWEEAKFRLRDASPL